MFTHAQALFLFHHVFLPAKTPQEDDFDPELGHVFFEAIQPALAAFGTGHVGIDPQILGIVADMVETMRTVHDRSTHDIVEGELQAAIRRVVENGGIVPIFVRAQNAAVVLRSTCEGLYFELFEVLPNNEAAMSTQGRLTRTFPDSTLLLDARMANDCDFQATIANTLALMSHQAVPGQQPQVKKAGEMMDEDRDTTHPGMVTEFFQGFLAGIGRFVPSQSIVKHTREQVSWLRARSPWRRSPLWLMLRVSLHLAFARLSHRPEDGHLLYKHFMIFLMSHIIRSLPKSEISSEVLYCMDAKVARRVNKLPGLNQALLTAVRQSTTECHREIAERWELMQRADKREMNLVSLENLDFEKDTMLHLPELEAFVECVQNQRSFEACNDFHPKSGVGCFAPDDLPILFNCHHFSDQSLELHAFEQWVAQNLTRWQKQNCQAASCGQLALLLENYHATATGVYANNPESVSMMVLVSLEMWIACDRTALAVEPRLADYDPEIPSSLLQNLLLPRQEHMVRLSKIERYLDARSRCLYTSSGIYQDVRSATSFAVRYFDSSSELQDLQRRILTRAADTKRAKIAEWQSLKAQYDRLMDLHYAERTCQTIMVWDRLAEEWRPQHSPSCRKCHYKYSASNLTIGIHEWPLPANATESKTVIFELMPPDHFSRWRDALVYLRHNILGAKYVCRANLRARHALSNHHDLSAEFRHCDDRRIGLMSENKPNLGTHRRGRELVTSDENNICLPSGLAYKYFDNRSDCFVSTDQFSDAALRACTYQMPASSSAMQKYLWRPASEPNGPSPNTVIASQSDCPDHLTLSEYKELCSVPLGVDLQWREIAAQLTGPTIDFQKTETALVLLQCAYQAGPPDEDSDELRAAHRLFHVHLFGERVLNGLRGSLARIRENWECVPSLDLHIALARRTLSLVEHSEVHQACVSYLADARAVAMNWVRQLQSKFQEAQDENARVYFRGRCAEAALVCASSFDVDIRFQDQVLTASGASILLQCSILVFNGKNALDSLSSARLPFLRRRHQCMLFDLHQKLTESHSALEHAVSISCVSYQPGLGWAVATGTTHWMVSAFTAGLHGFVFTVHLDLLTGELLVNGTPLDRLPRQYEEHTQYRNLFGLSTIDVVPSKTPGMNFDSQTEYQDHALEFGMTASTRESFSSTLLLRARSKQASSLLIPASVFRNTLPDSFVDDYFHWYDEGSETVDFRPHSNAWSQRSDSRWVLRKDETSTSWQLHHTRNDMSLVGLKSCTALHISAVFAPLAKLASIHLFRNHSSSALHIEFRQLSLQFDLQRGSSRVQSREYRDMVVAADQSVGTLVGYFNKLVLCQPEGSKRIVILAEGDTHIQNQPVACVTSAGGVDFTSVSLHSAPKRTHAYQVDERLQQLVSNGSLESQLLLVHLHGVTSFCLVDPLTGRTGTEQALSILDSAAVKSFNQLTAGNAEMLEKIAKLTPERTFYPQNERVMEQIIWSPTLSFMSQHPGFYKAAKALFAQATRQRMFSASPDFQLPELVDVDPSLLVRDTIRSSTFRVSRFGAEDFRTDQDVTYSARQWGEAAVRGLDAQIVTRLVIGKADTLHWSSPSPSGLWQFLQTAATQVNGPGQGLDSCWSRYDARYIKNGSTFVAENWPAIHLTLSSQIGLSAPNKFALAMCLSTLACSEIPRDVLGTLILLSTAPAFATMSPPTRPLFAIRVGYDARRLVGALVPSYFRRFEDCPEGHGKPKTRTSREASYDDRRSAAATFVERDLSSQWPCRDPLTPEGCSSTTYLRMSELMSAVTNTFRSCHDNLDLQQYLQCIQINAASSQSVGVPLSSPQTSRIPMLEPLPGFISHDELLQGPLPSLGGLDTFHLSSSSCTVSKQHPLLRYFVEALEKATEPSKYRQEYLQRLKKSLGALELGGRESCKTVPAREVLVAHREVCQENFQLTLNELLAATSSTGGENPASQSLSKELGQYPRLGTRTFASLLNHDHWPDLQVGWKKSVVDFGLALASLQRAERLVNASTAGKSADVIKELQNEGHTNWDPSKYPESLLLEIESDITIREVQEQIAAQMREPPQSHNSSMQLNMGEGKSSVIVPAVAAALADGSQLLRVIVAKPQSKQMAEMLIGKLGGLLNRRVYHMPFSRTLVLDEVMAKTIDTMCRECQANGGVLLVQPEHLLSFQLMVLERSICGKEGVAAQLLQTQRYFDQYARDIVDESDENFNVKFELIYTMGTQRPLDFCPDRWTTIADVLRMVKETSHEILAALPSSIEVEDGPPGSFPHTRILRSDAGEMLIDRIAQRVCNTGLPGFPLSRQKETTRKAVLKYISKLDLSQAEIDAVESDDHGGFWTESVRPTLLLLRGLLAGGVLVFGLARKRYSVNYGRDGNRRPPTRLAVPYRAKDQPSPRSDFSHPDVTILLTYMSYYYGHLDDSEMYLAFENLFTSDSRDEEYQSWVKGVADLPEAFRSLQGINLRDGPTCSSLVFPALRRVKTVIDFYLSTVVFPKELREFPHKLCASGWDIGRAKSRPTTAFSGTCDSYPLLPLDMTQLDLPEQQHTNALVLDYLLQPENTVLALPPKIGGQSHADSLLDQIMALDRPPRVILDAGAQVLDRSNRDMAQSWLERYDADAAEAVIFFDDEDLLSVLDRRGHVESLLTSPFSGRKDTCLVFLDEAHTRGTDLKLPIDYRAAITLGPGLTKDRLVQACMRMRQLGQGQTVVFVLPVEIQTKIREVLGLTDQKAITVADALNWAITQTHEDVQRGMPLWMRQGHNFDHQQSLWSECEALSSISATHASLFLEDVAKSLENRYRPGQGAPNGPLACASSVRAEEIYERCRRMEIPAHLASNLEEEQEKELSPEMEEERQTERPAPANPARHELHDDVIDFAVKGSFKRTSPAYQPAFQSLSNISAAESFDVSQLSGNELFATKDFARTIEASVSSHLDSYLRSVQWILTLNELESNSNSRPALIISPYEAQQLVHRLRKNSATTLHLFKPRWNTSFPALNKLDFFNCPVAEKCPIQSSAFLAQLDLFAGRTHFATHREYLDTCSFLNLGTRPADDSLVTAPDGFILEDRTTTNDRELVLKQSPVAFVKAVISIRAHHRDFAKTHMGKVLSGVLLSENDFEEEDGSCIS